MARGTAKAAKGGAAKDKAVKAGVAKAEPGWRVALRFMVTYRAELTVGCTLIGALAGGFAFVYSLLTDYRSNNPPEAEPDAASQAAPKAAPEQVSPTAKPLSAPAAAAAAAVGGVAEAAPVSPAAPSVEARATARMAVPSEAAGLETCTLEDPQALYLKVLGLIAQGRISGEQGLKVLESYNGLADRYRCRLYREMSGPGRLRPDAAARLSAEAATGLFELLEHHTTRDATLAVLKDDFATASLDRLEAVERARYERSGLTAISSIFGRKGERSSAEITGVASLIKAVRRRDWNAMDPLAAERVGGGVRIGGANIRSTVTTNGVISNKAVSAGDRDVITGVAIGQDSRATAVQSAVGVGSKPDQQKGVSVEVGKPK